MNTCPIFLLLFCYLPSLKKLSCLQEAHLSPIPCCLHYILTMAALRVAQYCKLHVSILHLGKEPAHIVNFYVKANKKGESLALETNTTVTQWNREIWDLPANSMEVLISGQWHDREQLDAGNQHRIQKGIFSGWYITFFCQGHCIRGELHFQNNRG